MRGSVDKACRKILMGTGVKERSLKTHTFPGLGAPNPTCFFKPGSLKGTVPRSLPRRTSRMTPSHYSKLGSSPPSQQIRESGTAGIQPPSPTPPPRSRRPLAAPGRLSPGIPTLQTRGLFTVPLGRRSFLLATRDRAGRDPRRAVLPSRPPLASGRQWRLLLPKRRRRRRGRGRVSHAAGAREPAPPPPSRAAV